MSVPRRCSFSVPRMTFWTNKSVLAMAAGRDPEIAMTERARQLALRAMSEGWVGPPYDPFELADMLKVPVVARDDLYDARVVPADGSALRIEYNPSRPRGRVRYSLAHELAHTLFPDVGEQVRYRSSPEGVHGDAWQLEMLCNIAAGELLMPAGTFPELTEEVLDIENLMALQHEYDVSTEALFLRVTRLSEQPATMFAASRADPDDLDAPLRLDYFRGSRAWQAPLRQGVRLRRDSVAYDCTAVGFTARGDEQWPGAGDVHIETVGIPPYPGQRLPRVVGLLRPAHAVTAAARRRIEYVRGDATLPRGAGPRVIAHLVNDRTPNWGGAFARALKDEYPGAQEAFRRWVQGSGDRLTLGALHVTELDDSLFVATMVAQRGYGPSSGPRVRYDALERCLGAVADVALEHGASVHMPRVGAGMAGGDWGVISELIDDALLARGVEVTVYIPPGEHVFDVAPAQQVLELQ